MENKKLLKKILPGVKENISLASHTAFKIGGPAKYFFIARTKRDLIKALKTAKDLKLPFFILAGGSNVLADDRGYRGLIIKIPNPKSQFPNKSKILNPKLKTIYAEAGVKLGDLVKLALNESLAGLEWAAGIPGTIGGAIYGNAGAFGKTMANIIKNVDVLDINSLKTKKINLKNCAFNNKDSVFKRKKNLIIIGASIRLAREEKRQIKEKMQEFLEYRRKNHPLDLPSAGCVFKNYIVKITSPALLKKFPELNEFNKGARIPVSYLIDKTGLKGKRIGNAKISEKHANFIINLGKARAKDVIKLIRLAKQKVKKIFGVALEEEIQFLGF